jgi:hypothetical protein
MVEGEYFFPGIASTGKLAQIFTLQFFYCEIFKDARKYKKLFPLLDIQTFFCSIFFSNKPITFYLKKFSHFK